MPGWDLSAIFHGTDSRQYSDSECSAVLPDDAMELGVGIHGEPGRERRRIAGADAIADELLEAVVTDLPYRSGDGVALMVNGLGGTPISELYILYRRAHRQLAERGITVRRSYVNEYCTSLDMAGASITLVRLDDGSAGSAGRGTGSRTARRRARRAARRPRRARPGPR